MATAFHESHKPTFFPRTEPDTPLTLSPPPNRGAVPKPLTKPPPDDQIRRTTNVPQKRRWVDATAT